MAEQSAPMIRKRSRPQPRTRKVSLEKEEVAEPTPENEAEAGLPYVPAIFGSQLRAF